MVGSDETQCVGHGKAPLDHDLGAGCPWWENILMEACGVPCVKIHVTEKVRGCQNGTLPLYQIVRDLTLSSPPGRPFPSDPCFLIRLSRSVLSVQISGKVLPFNFGNYPILAIRAPNKPGFGLLGWKSGNLFCGPLPAFFSQTPTRHRAFVENKNQTPIRPSGHRAVDPSSSRFFGPESRCFFLALAPCHPLIYNFS
jgi:hypothetical protein